MGLVRNLWPEGSVTWSFIGDKGNSHGVATPPFNTLYRNGLPFFRAGRAVEAESLPKVFDKLQLCDRII